MNPARRPELWVCAVLFAAAGCTLDRTPLSASDRRLGSNEESAGVAGSSVPPQGGSGGVQVTTGGSGGVGGGGLPDAGDPNDFFMLDAGVPALDVDSSVPIDTSVTCMDKGVYGVRAEIDVYWGGRDGGLVALTDNGRGKLYNYLRVTIGAVGASLDFVGTTRLCGIELPTFYSSTLCEAYKPEFPDALFEAASMPVISMSGQYQCLHPGCSVQFAPTAGLFGIDLQTPDAPWPVPGSLEDIQCSLGGGLKCYPDDDTDGNPGIGVRLRTSGKPGVPCNGTQDFSYNAAPLNANPLAIFGGVVRTDRIMLGVRSALGGSGVFDGDCSRAEGKGTARFLESRAAGCKVQPGSSNPGFPGAAANQPCTKDEATFMDENMPIYLILEEGQVPTLPVADMSPSQGTLFSLVRLGDIGDPASCRDVRDAF